ncbi:aminotransferase class IV [Streptomyces genisteinicus]|uniref:Aminotransferase class IV n=2 Tax=Streptomyces genisteinicus TaxID=2768068 RepID=A0A7H0I4E4_9ACTN|nr:aminotransferase class IV [Streptomyces genisteinicus]
MDGLPRERELPFGSNSVQHGTAVFEGIRMYAAPAGPALFRLDAHLQRLLDSAALLGIPHAYDLDALRRHVRDAAAGSGLDSAYVRPVLYTREARLGVNLQDFRFTLGTEIWALPADDTPPRPLRVTVSPWCRPSRSSFAVRAKATGTYVVSALARTRAAADGFDDAVQLDPDSGRVAESTIANVFLVRDGRLVTPWLEDSVLAGITRDTVLTLAGDLGIETSEAPVLPGDLLAADEVFLTGTASGLVPVAGLDTRTYPAVRPVTDALGRAYRRAVLGDGPHRPSWLTPVSRPTPSTSRL